MADYQKMYNILCCAVDSVIDSLEKIPLAQRSVQILLSALNAAEDVYIDTVDDDLQASHEKASV